MKQKISLLLPTRNRPEQLEKMFLSALKLSKYKNIEMCCYVDEDDDISIEKLTEILQKYPDKIFWLQNKRITLSDTYNWLGKIASGDIYFICGDDIHFETENWDEMVYNLYDEYPDSIVFCGPHDGYNKDTITHFFLSKKSCDLLGYVTPNCYSADFADTHMQAIYNMLGRVVRLPFNISHNHYAAGKGVIDNTMQEKLNRVNTGENHFKYIEMESSRVDDSIKLRKHIEGFNDNFKNPN